MAALLDHAKEIQEALYPIDIDGRGPGSYANTCIGGDPRSFASRPRSSFDCMIF
jgi:hypothetical protein